MQPLQNFIGPTFCIGRESWCLPYAGFFIVVRNLSHCPDILQTLRKSSIQSVNLHHYLEVFQNSGNLADGPEHFPDCTEIIIFTTIHNSSILSENLPDCPKIFKILCEGFFVCLNDFVTAIFFLLQFFIKFPNGRNFLGSNTTLLPRFFSLCNYTSLHYTTIHYAKLNYTTIHYCSVTFLNYTLEYIGNITLH